MNKTSSILRYYQWFSRSQTSDSVKAEFQPAQTLSWKLHFCQVFIRNVEHVFYSPSIPQFESAQRKERLFGLLNNHPSDRWKIVPATVEKLCQWLLKNNASATVEEFCDSFLNRRASDCSRILLVTPKTCACKNSINHTNAEELCYN